MGVRIVAATGRRMLLLGGVGAMLLGVVSPATGQVSTSSPEIDPEPGVAVIVGAVEPAVDLGGEAGQSNTELARVINCKIASDYCYYSCTVTYGIGPTTVGSWRGEITLTIFGRDVNWYQASDVTSGPTIRARHEYNCVDDNGALPNSSLCTGGWQSQWNSVYTTAKWTWPNPRSIFLQDNDTYWFDWETEWYASGYGTTKWYAARLTTDTLQVRASTEELLLRVVVGRGSLSEQRRDRRVL